MARMQENQSGRGTITNNQTMSSMSAMTYKQLPADRKIKKKMSGLRRAIRAIFRPKEKQAANVPPTESHMPRPEMTSARLQKGGIEDINVPTKAVDTASPDDQSPVTSCESSSQSSSSTPSSTKSLEASAFQSEPVSTILSPPETPPSAPDATASSRPIKCSPPAKTPACANKSGFYMYNGHPSYLGSHLYQRSDLEPEMDILGQWVELGSGETGTTRLVHILTESGKLAAAKIIQGDNSEARFRNEIDAFHIVRGHPSFPQLIGVVEQSPLRCILQEFVGNDFIPENITLEDVLRDNKISSSEIPHSDWLQIAKDVADGIMYLHQQDYIHSNIKPENILLYATDGSRRGWRAKICDLGDCTFKKLAPKILSTPEIRAAAEATSKPFVAPEVLSGETPYTTAADVYAFGRVLRTIGKRTKITSIQQLGKKCSRSTDIKRPDMERVCRMLSRSSSS